MGGKAWTEEEIEYLRRNYQAKTSQEMADHLGRSKDSTHLYVNRYIKEKGTRKKRSLESYASKNETKIGDRFNNLVVKELFFKKTENGDRSFAKCECVCGNIVERQVSQLFARDNHSCGCKQYRFVETHGKLNHPAYSSWLKMRDRCNNPNNDDYHRYGGRGIFICEEWNDAGVFCDWADENGYKKGLKIERKNNNLGYCPENCTWSTDIEQANNRENNRKLTLLGETKTVAEWSRDERAKVGEMTIRYRIDNGWSDAEAVLITAGEKPKPVFEHQNQDEIGKTYGRLTIKSIYVENKYGQNITYCTVSCKCGNDTINPRKLTTLKSHEGIPSCGCATRELASERITKQNESRDLTKNPLYARWNTALVRCKEKSIEVSSEWEDFSNYNDWCMSNGWREGYRVQLIDTKREFGPNNCVVKPPKDEDENNNSNILLSAFGETKTITEWLKDSRCKTNYGTMRSRYYKGELTHEEIITTPSRVLDKSNQSGVEGISWAKDRKKWSVYVKEDGKRKLIGQFRDLEEAIKAQQNH